MNFVCIPKDKYDNSDFYNYDNQNIDDDLVNF